jgi:hypothetical protein
MIIKIKKKLKNKPSSRVVYFLAGSSDQSPRVGLLGGIS